MLLGFKKRFAAPILEGTKKFTIRERRKIEPKIGERLYMYTGLRTSDCQKITDEHRLVSIQLVDFLIQDAPSFRTMDVLVDGRYLTEDELVDFVIADGFTDFADFRGYWLEGVKPNSFGVKSIQKNNLVLHHWTDLKY